MAKKPVKRQVRLADSNTNPFALFRSEVSAVSGVKVKAEDAFDPEEGSQEYEKRDMDDFSITAEVEAILNDTNIVARDMKIDDSSMEQAKSFWHWCTDSQFLGEHVSPYLEQALIGIKLFGEYCPHCSDTEWMKDENHKPQEGLNGIRKHVVALEHGVCPKCGARRSQMIRNGELNFYNELAVNAGQRCVTGETTVSISGEHFNEAIHEVQISALLPADYDGGTGFYDLPKGVTVLGKDGYQSTDKIFVSRVDELWEVELSNGMKLCGTREHPVWHLDMATDEEGFLDLKDIKVGMKLWTVVGWSTVVESKKSERRERTYDLHVPDTHEYFTNNILSHNSGKSIVVALISTYIVHRTLMMQKPTEIYRVGPNQMLHGAFVALTAGQAKDTLYEPFYGYILESPWFKKYHALLDYYQQKYKQTIYKVMDSYIMYRHRNLFVHYAGPDKRVLRGRTRIFASIDEIGWFDNSKDSGKVKVDASEVYIALERSLLTCRSAEEYQLDLGYDECMSAYFLNISSPSSVRDKICELVRLSDGSTKLLGLHKPTWEMNPNVPQDSPIILEAYRKDPVTAERDYGANPPLSSNPFIRSRSMVMDCMKDTGRNFIKYSQQIFRAKDGGKYRYGTIQKIKTSTEPSIMAIDAGLTNNSFAMVIGTRQDKNINLDLLVEIMPLPGIPLHYTMIYEHLILPIIEARNVRVLLADRWNSVKLLQDAETQSDRLQIAKSYSVKYSDLWNTKASIESGLLKYPRSDETDVDTILGFDPDNYPRCFVGRESEHLILQMLTVQDTGKQVIKGDNLTDDIWRAAVLMEWGLNNPDFDQYMTVDETNKYKAGLIGVSRRGLVTASNSGRIRTQGTKFLSVRSSRK